MGTPPKYKPIRLESGKAGAEISLPMERKATALPIEARTYLWIGNDESGCFGVVPDKEVKRLRDWCDEILAARAKT